MLTIVPPHADDFRWPHRSQQRGFYKRKRRHPLARQIFQFAARFFRRTREKPRDYFFSRDQLNQAIGVPSIQLKPAIFHRRTAECSDLASHIPTLSTGEMHVVGRHFSAGARSRSQLEGAAQARDDFQASPSNVIGSFPWPDFFVVDLSVV